MMKQIALLKAKPGMSREAFIDRYENGHVPLVHDILPFFQDYRRSYVLPAAQAPHRGRKSAPPPFDVVTELWFEGPSKVEELRRAITATDVGGRIARDEQDLFDRTDMAMFAVDERITPAEHLQPRPPDHAGTPSIKRVALLTRKAGMSRDDFIEHYEQCHAPLAQRILSRNGRCIFADYRRNYPLPGSFGMPHVEQTVADVPFDVLNELWFWTQEDYAAFTDLVADPAIRDMIAKDEEKFIDRSNVVSFMAKEHISAI